MTKFKTLNSNKKEKKETVFTHYVDTGKTIEKTDIDEPEQWKNVLHIGYDDDYGDVFKAWNEDDQNEFVIFFGQKGDEFED